MPPEAWGALGVLGGALIAGFVAWMKDRSADKNNAGTLALALAQRLDARVEVLERERNAYRSWSHVLWSHIYDEQAPRLPAPSWPVDLAR